MMLKSFCYLLQKIWLHSPIWVQPFWLACCVQVWKCCVLQRCCFTAQRCTVWSWAQIIVSVEFHLLWFLEYSGFHASPKNMPIDEWMTPLRHFMSLCECMVSFDHLMSHQGCMGVRDSLSFGSNTTLTRIKYLLVFFLSSLSLILKCWVEEILSSGWSYSWCN